MSRQQLSFRVRVDAARIARDREVPVQTPRGDNTERKVESYTKGLPHNRNTGILVNPRDYDLFVRAIETGDVKDIRAIPLGPNATKSDRFRSGISRGNGSRPIADVRAWESMAAGNTFDLEGPDAQSLAMPPHPAIDSAELIAEMTEIYNMALVRDVPFIEFDDNRKVAAAVRDMNRTDWVGFRKNPPPNLTREERMRLRGPFKGDSIFRGTLHGDDVGPYLSQFILAGNSGVDGNEDPANGFITYGGQRIDQRVRFVEPRRDYMTTWESWLDVQNGADLRGREIYNDGYRFIATPRDLATYVHFDALYQAYLNACIILLGLRAPFDKGIPFQLDDDIDKQQGFATFGDAHILSLVTEVATRALKAVRFQKFNVHRRPRPERLGGLIQRFHIEPNREDFQSVAALSRGLDDDLLDRVAKENGRQNREFSDFGNPRSADFDPTGTTGENFLLPMAFPEGSPMHPSYGAGHAVVAGACVTILKAWFNTDWELPFVFEPNRDGSRLISRYGPKLTVGGELNKICSNICIGRNWAGVHYFTDYIESIKLGEDIAVGILEEQMLTYQEKVSMTLKRFDNSVITISNKH